MTAPAPAPTSQPAAPAAPAPNPVKAPTIAVGASAIPAPRPSAPKSNAADAAAVTAQPLSPSIANTPTPHNGQLMTAQQAADMQAQEAAALAEQAGQNGGAKPAVSDTPLNDQLIERWNAQLDRTKVKGASTPNMLPAEAYGMPGKTIAPAKTPYNPFESNSVSGKLWSFGLNAANASNLLRKPPGRFDNAGAPHLRSHPWIQATAGHMAEMPGASPHPLAALVGNVLGPQLGEFVGQQVTQLPNYLR